MIIDVIGGTQMAKQQDDILHACDMFEPFKRFAIHSRVEVNGVDAEIAIDMVRAAYRKEKGFVLFAGVIGESAYHLEQGISVISTISSGKTGSGWLMFSDMLKTLGYSPVMDSTMKVTSLKEFL